MRQDRAIDLHPAPEMAELQILIRTVLMIVGIDDGHSNHWKAQLFKYVHGSCSAEGWHFHSGACGSFDDLDHFLRNWKVHRRPRSAITSFIDDFCDARIRPPFFHRGLAIDDVEALLSYKQGDLIEFLLRVLSSYKTSIERSLRTIGNNVLRLFAHVRAAQSADIQRRLHTEFNQLFRVAFRFGSAQLPF